MTIDEMNIKKKEYGYSYEYIAEKSGVPVSTVQKVLGGVTESPRRKTLEALYKAFEGSSHTFEAKTRGSYLSEEQNTIGFVNEGDYKTDGTGALKAESDRYGLKYNMNSLKGKNDNKTIEDYLNLPEGIRVELIDGNFYDLAAPSNIHQCISMAITNVFSQFIDSNNGSCIPFAAPADVQLDCDDKTMVQPDIFVVCDRSKITRQRTVGAPDLVIEILSESNSYNDLVRKLIKYKRAGVREYWIISPEDRSVAVYFFEKSDLPTEYTFNDSVPVNIWDGKCVVDFKKIYEKISFLLE